MEKVELTIKLIQSIRFEERIMGVQNGKIVIEAVPEGKRDYYINDSKVDGFTLRVTSSGAKTFVVRKRLKGGNPINYICGSYPSVTLDDARKKAISAIRMIDEGQDPNLVKKAKVKATQVEQTKQKTTFEHAFHKYSDSNFFPGFSSLHLTEVKLGLKEGRINETFSIKTAKDHKDVEKWLKETILWKTPFHEINMDSIIEPSFRPLYKDVSTGNKIFRYCRAAWNHATIGVEHATRNPFSDWNKKYKPPKTPRRQTSLDTDSKAGEKWLKTISTWKKDPMFHRRVMADYVLLTLIWGTRKNEALPLDLDNLFFDKKAVVIRDPKNGVDHWIPMTPLVEELLLERKKDNESPRNVKRHVVTSSHVFPSRFFGKHLTEPSAFLEKADKNSGLKITLHDLRRTFAGEIFALSKDSLTTKLAMNHSSGTDDITASYIMIKPKLETLRPLFEQREKKLFKLAGLLP